MVFAIKKRESANATRDGKDQIVLSNHARETVQDMENATTDSVFVILNFQEKTVAKNTA